MPILDRSKYPSNWKEISKEQLKRAGNKCELCSAMNAEPHWKTGSTVVLTVHHIEELESLEEHNSYPNLIVLCQRCHLRLDLGRHIRNVRKTRLRNNRRA